MARVKCIGIRETLTNLLPEADLDRLAHESARKTTARCGWGRGCAGGCCSSTWAISATRSLMASTATAEPNTTVKIRAYQNDNGHAIDVLDEGGSAVGSTTSLARPTASSGSGWKTRGDGIPPSSSTPRPARCAAPPLP